MPGRFRRWLLALAACQITICGVVPGAQAESVADCEQAGRAAEQQFGVPPGLLLAIGRVESGRWDAALRRVVPWPWAIDVNGAGRQFDNGSQAVSATLAAQAEGQRSIDVGCFQINLLHHPDAFPNLNQAFDAPANAQYAARFLASLQERLGNWQDAVAAYHSATPELGVPYRQRVFTAWSGASAASEIVGRQFPGFPGIRVWQPSPAGSAPAAVAIDALASPSLPRVITPTR
jgi:hypothetical protein